MSQILTYDTALTLKRGDILFHNILEFGLVEGAKDPATCTVSGKVRKISGVEEFELPVRRNYGDKAATVLTRMSRDLWRTTPEKLAPVRVRRERTATTPPIPEATLSEESKTPDIRARRTRTTVTGRIIDEGEEHTRLLGTALAQQATLFDTPDVAVPGRVRRTRST